MDQRSVRMSQNDGRARVLDSDKVEHVSQMRLLGWNRRQLGDRRSQIFKLERADDGPHPRLARRARAVALDVARIRRAFL